MKPLLMAGKITLYLEECQSLFDAVNGVKTIDDFVKRVELLSQKYASDQDALNTFKGDMLEVLAEIFFRIFAADPAVGISDYRPVPLSEDYGVDGIGTNPNGDACAIQDKYRVNPLENITYADIARTYTAGVLRHHLSLDKNDNIILFTTGNDVSSACHDVFGSKLRIINRKIISSYIDNNQTFWGQAEKLILFTLNGL